MEVEVISPMLFEGKPIGPDAQGRCPVIDLPQSEAVYLEQIGRVRRLLDSPAETAPAKGKKK